MVATRAVSTVFSSCFFMLPRSTKVEAQLCRYAPSLLLAIGSSCPHPIRSQCLVSPPSVGTHPSIGSKVRILACCSKRSPRSSLVKVGNRMFQAFPMEVWSTLAMVNRSFSEALRGGERKSQRGRFRLASPAVRVAIVPLSIFSNPSLVVLVRARGAKRASR